MVRFNSIRGRVARLDPERSVAGRELELSTASYVVQRCGLESEESFMEAHPAKGTARRSARITETARQRGTRTHNSSGDSKREGIGHWNGLNNP